MTIDEIVEYFGNFYRMCKRTGLTYGCLYRWKKLGYIPYSSQKKIEIASGGVLKVRMEDGKLGLKDELGC